DNIAQTAQFVETGAADIGLIALSLAVAPAMKDKGRYILVPPESYPKLEQAGIILNSAQDKPAAEALTTFLKSAAAQEILKRYGFTLPEKSEPRP
ncbi:MAG: molybdate ABC transporter substrate-binding protein, partial [Phycisphaerae bacterium]